MPEQKDNMVKTREIAFAPLHPVANQALAAARILQKQGGTLNQEVISPTLLRVRYHLSGNCFSDIMFLLETEGFHLANELIYRLKRALYCYTEETQRANMGCAKGDPNCTQKVFVNRYRRVAHGCRDRRPEHWRQYL